MTSSQSRRMEWHPFKTFPEIAWIRIISHVTSFSDLLNLVEASNHLKRLVTEVYKADMVFHLVARYVGIKNLRKLRPVSSRWNEIAVKYLDDLHREFDWESNSKHIVRLSTPQTLQRWSTEMNPTIISPSTCRSFDLTSRGLNDEDKDEFHSLVIQHLAIYGHHTWNLNTCFPNRISVMFERDATLEIINNLEFIRSCLEHVPNIKSIFLPTLCTSTPSIGYVNENFPYGVDYGGITSWIKSHPFPRLPNLTRFYTPQFQSILTKKMLKLYQSQIQMLSLTIGNTLGGLKFNGLLRCCITRKCHSPFNNFHERVIRKMGKGNLTQLKVEFAKKSNRPDDFFGDDVNASLWELLSRILQLVKNNLELLSIKVPWEWDTSRPGLDFVGSVTLPKLKRFEIYIEDVKWLFNISRYHEETMLKLKRFEMDIVDSKWFGFLVKFAPNLEHYSVNPKGKWEFEWASFFDKQGSSNCSKEDLVHLKTVIIHGITYQRLTNGDSTISYTRT